MNAVKLGPLRLEFDTGESALHIIEGLMRHLSNKEVGGLLGISERTVRRWKCAGRLPSKDNEQVSLLELLIYFVDADAADALDMAQRAMQTARLQ